MKSISDRVLLQRKASLAHIASLGGLVVLIVAVAFSLILPSEITLLEALLVAGFLISVFGVYYANRWVKKPRPEDVLDKALGSFNDYYRLYHYLSPCDHLLLTPSGLVIFEAVNLDGQFSYSGGRWRKRFSMNRALRYIFDERLGDPVARAQASAREVGRRIARRLEGGGKVPVSAVVVFVHPAAEINVEKPPIPVVKPKNLNKQVSRKAAPLPNEVYQTLQTVLDEVIASPGKRL